MVVNHEKKFVFIHIGKTAGDSVTYVLKPYCDISKGDVIVEDKSKHKLLHKHAKSYEIQEAFADLNWNWQDYYKFAVIRNPYEILHSDYYYHKYMGYSLFPNNEMPNSNHENDTWILKCHRTKSQTFEEYVEENYGHWDRGFLRIWCMTRNGIINVNNIYQQKTISQNFPSICEKLGLGKIELINGNVTGNITGKARPPVQQDFTPKLKSFVQKTFAEDLAIYNYTLEEAK